MRRLRILMAVGPVLAVTACSGSPIDGEALRLGRLDAEVAGPCADPRSVLVGVPGGLGTIAGVEVALGRMGDELIECGEEKAIAVSAYENAAAALSGGPQ